MSGFTDFEEHIRNRAYALWERAGKPHGRSDEFWHAARAELNGEEAVIPLSEPPAVLAQHGVPVGMPGERIVEQGVLDDRVEDLAIPQGFKKVED
jgi:hypothetical protein